MAMKAMTTLKRKSRPAGSRVDFNVATPEVHVQAPVTVDLQPISEVLDGLAKQIIALGKILGNAMAQHDKRLVELAARQETLLAKLAEQKTSVVKAPPKQLSRSGYDVAFIRDEQDNELLGMQLRPMRVN